MSKYASRYTSWCVMLSILGIIACVCSLGSLERGTLLGVGLLAVALSLSHVIPLEMFGLDTLSLAPGIELAASLILGVPAAIAAAIGYAMGVLVRTRRKEHRAQLIVHLAAVAPGIVAAACTGWYVRSIGFMAQPVVHIPSLVTAALIYFTVRALLGCVSDSLRYNISAARQALRFPIRMLGWVMLQLGVCAITYWVYSILGISIGLFVGHVVFALLVMYAARLYFGMRSTYWSTVLALIPAIESEVMYAEAHSMRVATYSVAIARKLLLGQHKMFGVFLGALFHDVGMAGVDERIFNKPGRLTDEEYCEMQKHVEIGAKVISKVPFLAPALPAVMYHHERWDGSGYPKALAARKIPLEARVVGVADVFDALRSPRPYRQALSIEEALNEIKQLAGKEFDPEVVTALEQAAADEIRWGKDAFAEHYSIDVVR